MCLRELNFNLKHKRYGKTSWEEDDDDRELSSAKPTFISSNRIINIWKINSLGKINLNINFLILVGEILFFFFVFVKHHIVVNRSCGHDPLIGIHGGSAEMLPLIPTTVCVCCFF